MDDSTVILSLFSNYRYKRDAPANHQIWVVETEFQMALDYERLKPVGEAAKKHKVSLAYIYQLWLGFIGDVIGLIAVL